MDSWVFIPYNRAFAVRYARRWANDRNPLFANYSGLGGDCTNFVSQCVFAGSCVMNYTPVYGWYYVSETDRAPAWTSVVSFFDFITRKPEFAETNGGIGPFGEETDRGGATIGDVIQLADGNGEFYHSLLISAAEGDELFVAAHSEDHIDRPLSSYTYASLRFLHVTGVRAAAEYPCFEPLIDGEALPRPPREPVSPET